MNTTHSSNQACDRSQWRDLLLGGSCSAPNLLRASVKSQGDLQQVVKGFGEADLRQQGLLSGLVVLDSGKGDECNVVEAFPNSTVDKMVEWGEAELEFEEGLLVRRRKVSLSNSAAGGREEFQVEQVQLLGKPITIDEMYLVHCWQVHGQGGNLHTYLKVNGKHPYVGGQSVLSIKNIHPSVDGKQLVHSVFHEQGAGEGPTLLCIADIPKIVVPSGEASIWDWYSAHGKGLECGVCKEIASVVTSGTLYHVRRLHPPIAHVEAEKQQQLTGGPPGLPPGVVPMEGKNNGINGFDFNGGFGTEKAQIPFDGSLANASGVPSGPPGLSTSQSQSDRGSQDPGKVQATDSQSGVKSTRAWPPGLTTDHQSPHYGGPPGLTSTEYSRVDHPPGLIREAPVRYSNGLSAPELQSGSIPSNGAVAEHHVLSSVQQSLSDQRNNGSIGGDHHHDSTCSVTVEQPPSGGATSQEAPPVVQKNLSMTASNCEVVEEEEEEEESSSDSEENFFAPFDPESYGLGYFDGTPERLSSALITFKSMLDQMLVDIVQSLRFIIHADPSGLATRQQLLQCLMENPEPAIMTRGNALCLVMQRLYPSIAKAVTTCATIPMFHGGCLLHLLFGLEEIYRTKQVNLYTYREEEAPSNPFLHMDRGCIETRPLGTAVRKPLLPESLPSPYVANIQDLPDLTEVSTAHIRGLFRHAPFLLQKQVGLPKFMSKMKDYIGQREAGPMRTYQEECVKRVEQGGNWIIVAPTGAGKTKIFVECSRQLLQNNYYGTIVVVCPTVPLATQQAAVYVVEGFLQERYWVNAFNSENQLQPELWEHIVRSHNVMVMTPQIFINVMQYFEKEKPMHEGNHVFLTIEMLVLDECHHTKKDHPYNKIMSAYRKTEGSQTQEECQMELDLLLQNMRAKCVVIGEQNREVQQYVPSAKERTVYTEPRAADGIFARAVGSYLAEALVRYIKPLVGKVQGIMKLPDNCQADMKKGLNSSFFENWTKTCLENLENGHWGLPYYQRIDIITSCELLRCCNNSLDLLKDAGFESALKYLAKKCTELSQKFNGQTNFNEWMYPKLLAGLYAVRPIQNATTVLQAFRMSPDSSNFERLPRFVELVKFLEGYSENEMFHGIVFVKTRDGVYHLANMLRNHPQLRFLTPIEFIGHGRSQKKNNSKSAYLDPDAASGALRGMTGNRQREILERFSEPGRHVLVATRAAEEGINVTTCEFVVRYSVTETGIERVQSRGRTRVNDGVFFNIIERESKEDQMFEKSKQEETTMNLVLKLSRDVEHI